MTYNFPDNIQRGIIYFLKSERDFYLQVNSLIKPEYFDFPAHGEIFRVINSYFDEYKKLPNDDFIIQDLKKVKRKSASESDYQDELSEINQLQDTDYLSNKDYYLDLAEAYAKREALKEAIKTSLEYLQDDEDRMPEIEHLVRDALLISREVDTGQNYFRDVDSRFSRLNDTTKVYKYPTVLETINHHLDGGNSAKELCMVVAPPGVGKSLYLVNQAYHTLMLGKKVLYISLEMSEDKISARFDSVISRINSKEFKVKDSIDKLNQRLKRFLDTYPGSGLVIKEFPTGMANVNTIRTFLHNLKNHDEFVPDLIIVDYLELLRPVRNIDAEYIAQQRIAEELRGLGVEHNVLIWTATQPNREGRKVEIITDAQLGDSYGKIRVADFAISINQTEEEYENGYSRVYVMKARDAKQRYVIGMNIDYNTLVMSERVVISTEQDESLNKLKKQVENLV